MAGQITKLEMFINRASLGNNELANNELGVGIYRALKRLETEKGWLTEIARNNGPGPGVGTGLNYHNEANPAVSPFWAYFRWNATARRPKDSYILFQYGVSPSISSGVGAPARVFNTTNPSVRGWGFSWAALQNNLNVAVNPWGGGAPTTKGNPVYLSPGVGERLDILPAPNGPGGTYAATREVLAGAGASSSYSTSIRAQVVADEDNILVQTSIDASSNSCSFLLSTYVPLPGVIVDYPVFICCAFSTGATSIFPADMAAIGTLTNSLAAFEGGVIAPSGVRIANVAASYAHLIEPGYQPNSNISGSAWDLETVMVGVNGGGRLGYIDPAFLRVAGQVPWGQIFDSGARVSVDQATANRARAVVTWDSATAPGSGATREGVDGSI
jgi:hypothetical protein